jgi:L-ornithine N5-oxygenase
MTPPGGSPTYHSLNGLSNGAKQFNLDGSTSSLFKSYLQPTHENELHDIVCVGFGPAALAIAVALHDSLESENPDIPKLDGRLPKVAFLEKQPNFAWHAGMLLEGAKMQISFIKDMATLRNPRSSFTFINYLHVKDRLVQFTNLNTFLPQRIEFEDYLRWCASWFDDIVQYRQEVVEIRPETMRQGGKTIDSFTVFSRDTTTQQITARRAKHVIIAAGGRANISRPFPTKHPRLLHSSQYAYRIPDVLKDRQAPYHIAVIGGGQSAAEIFNNLHSKYPNATTRLIIKSAALRPSDDSPL